VTYYFEFEKIIADALGAKTIHHKISIKNVYEEGIDLENMYINISITFRYNDFGLSFQKKINNEKIEITDLLLRKYPDYFESKSNYNLFKFKETDFSNTNEYLKMLVKTSFDFIEDNFPEVFKGKF
jgi:hypothetical protein